MGGSSTGSATPAHIAYGTPTPPGWFNDPITSSIQKTQTLDELLGLLYDASQKHDDARLPELLKAYTKKTGKAKPEFMK